MIPLKYPTKPFLRFPQGPWRFQLSASTREVSAALKAEEKRQKAFFDLFPVRDQNLGFSCLTDTAFGKDLIRLGFNPKTTEVFYRKSSQFYETVTSHKDFAGNLHVALALSKSKYRLCFSDYPKIGGFYEGEGVIFPGGKFKHHVLASNADRVLVICCQQDMSAADFSSLKALSFTPFKN